MNNGWKCPVQWMAVSPVRLALLMLGSGWPTSLLLAVLLVSLSGSVPMALAQLVPNTITAMTVSPRGDLILSVEGEGFDPILRLESVGNGQYRVVVQAPDVTLAPGVSGINGHLGQDFHARIPAIETGKITAFTHKGQAAGAGVQVILTAWRKLQPQILSNDGHQIVITLIGDRSLPPAIAARQRRQLQQAEQARLTAQKLAEVQALAQQRAAQQSAALKLSDGKKAELLRNAPALVAPDPLGLTHAPSFKQSVTPKPSETKAAPELLGKATSGRLDHAERSTVQTVYQAYPQPEEVEYEAELAHEQIALAARRREAMARRERLANAGVQTITPAPDAEPEAITQLQLANLGAKPNAFSALAQTAQSKPPASDTDSVASARSKAPSASQGRTQGPAYQPIQMNPPASTATPTTPSPSAPQSAPRTDEPAPFSWLGPPATPAGTGHETAPSVAPSADGPGEPEDNSPTQPLRLTRPPEQLTPEPEEAQPSRSNHPAGSANESQRPEHAPSVLDRQATSAQKPAFPASGSDAARLQSIYAVMHEPQASPMLRQAWAELMAGQSNTAEAHLQNRLQEAPDDVAARYLLAQILLAPLSETGTNASSASSAGSSDVDQARRLQARREQAQVALLKNYQQARHWPSAQALLELYLEDGKLEAVNQLLNVVRSVYPNQPGVAYEEGRLQEALVDLDAARKAYQRALALQPDNPEVHYRLAQVELKSSHLEAARWELLQALSWSPNDGRLTKLLGYIADKSGNPAQAAEAYRQALPVDALINYARTLEAQHHPDRALSLYQAAETLAGDNREILYNLAMIYHETHRIDRASDMLRRFLALGGKSDDARVRKAQAILKQMGETP